MRAVRFEQYGGVDVLDVVEVERPEPRQGQLLVSVRAAGINPGEAKIREGLLDERFPASFPSGQGSDLAGVVQEVGPDVVEFSRGDEVIGFTNLRASQAELALVTQSEAVKRPADVPWEAGGALFVAGVTAYAMVEAVGVVAGETVIVAGATGGVGTLAVQLARLRGATVIGIAGERHGDWLAQHGVIHVRYGDGVERRITDAVAGGSAAGSTAPAARPSAMLDCVGGDYVELALALRIPPARIDTIVDFEAAARHSGVRTDGNAAGASAEVLQALVDLIAAGELEVPIARTFPLEQVREAYTALAQDHPLGKVVLIP